MVEEEPSRAIGRGTYLEGRSLDFYTDLFVVEPKVEKRDDHNIPTWVTLVQSKSTGVRFELQQYDDWDRPGIIHNYYCVVDKDFEKLEAAIRAEAFPYMELYHLAHHARKLERLKDVERLVREIIRSNVPFLLFSVNLLAGTENDGERQRLKEELLLEAIANNPCSENRDIAKVGLARLYFEIKDHEKYLEYVRKCGLEFASSQGAEWYRFSWNLVRIEGVSERLLREIDEQPLNVSHELHILIGQILDDEDLLEKRIDYLRELALRPLERPTPTLLLGWVIAEYTYAPRRKRFTEALEKFMELGASEESGYEFCSPRSRLGSMQRYFLERMNWMGTLYHCSSDKHLDRVLSILSKIGSKSKQECRTVLKGYREQCAKVYRNY